MTKENDDIQSALMADRLAGMRMDDAPAAVDARPLRAAMTDAQVNHMVDRFLSWKLPEQFHPDAGITFEPRYNVGNIYGWPEGKHEPVGTNLFTATQATEMVRFMLDGLPQG